MDIYLILLNVSSDRLQFGFQYKFNRTNKNHNFFAVPTVVSCISFFFIFSPLLSFFIFIFKFRNYSYTTSDIRFRYYYKIIIKRFHFCHLKVGKSMKFEIVFNHGDRAYMNFSYTTS